MYDIKACLGCLRTNVKLIRLDSGKLRCDFQLITGIRKKDTVGMPDYLCYQCAAMLRSCIKFRKRCQRAHYTLKEILNRDHQINQDILQNIDCQALDLMPPLSYMNTSNHLYENLKYQWNKYNRVSSYLAPQDEVIAVVHCSTISDEDSFNVTNIPVEQDDTKDYLNEFDNKLDFFDDPITNVDDPAVDNNQLDSDDVQDTEVYQNTVCKTEEEVDGSKLDEEYAIMMPITMKEAKAALEVYKLFSAGKHKCPFCNKSYCREERLKTHLRMHDMHISGSFKCELCNVFYKTDFLLKTHMTEKHMYKYICRKCPEVSFDRTSAKQHFIWVHLQKGSKKTANWYDVRPTWLSKKGGKRTKRVVSLRPVKKLDKLPEDFLIYSPISQEEQYGIVEQRKWSRNFKEAKYQCSLCYRGYQLLNTYNAHMQKHDPAIFGELQCDMCKLHFQDHRKMYKHMSGTHLFKYSCQMCTFTCYNKGQAQMHYRFHKNVTYECPHCKKVFTKSSTRLTHIRIKHPSMSICNICGHSFVSDSGLYFHKNLKHTKEEIEIGNNLGVDKSNVYYCKECDIQFLNEAAFDTHLGSSYKHVTINVSTRPGRSGKCKSEAVHRPRGRPRADTEVLNIGLTMASTCEVCKTDLPNDRVARRHYEANHPDTDYLKRYMCDVCGHTTRQYANLLVHMRTHTKEKPYACPHCPRRFSMPSNRDRHIVVHTGEKKFQCHHCSRRFTQSSGVKLHIQTVHLKIPYAPWNKKNRKRKKELENASVSTAACLPPPPAQHKLAYDQHGDYINAYITYNDE